MAICPRVHYRCLKYIVTIIVITFFGQILLALNFFPSINDDKSVSFKRNDVPGLSVRKMNVGFEDDEDLSQKSNKQTSRLRLEELDFEPMCQVKSREAISAIHRAKTQNCKKQILNITCLIQNGKFYPDELPNHCLSENMKYGKYLGCYQDEKKSRLLSSFYGNYANTNSPAACLDICVQAGFPFAGVQYASECFCGETSPPDTAKIDDGFCEMSCPGDASNTCGGYFTMNVYETGLSKFSPRVPILTKHEEKRDSVRIIFLLTLNGRAIRQVYRLINVLYNTKHYFYIHVDARQDYLHRELSPLQQKFPNIKLAINRFSTIWGGASLLQMLLAAMKDFFELGWQWDYVINLSESDYPIKSLKSLENFLHLNRGLNFVKSHGREVQRFIKKQGLDKTFIECENHMWRTGERKLPRKIVIDGGSDWIALSPEFVSYVVGEHDELLAGLNVIFQHTLLPAESFFHTALRNSKYCQTYVDNNLHVTNWKRKLGCKCQYKHVVDWCGCSPNDFRTEDWPRIQNTQDRQLFFARKFEPIINQHIITKVEQSIGYDDHHLLPNLEAYWQSIYNHKDLTANSDDTILTHANSIVRHNAKILYEWDCIIEPGEILEINSYNDADVYKGNLVLHKVLINKKHQALVETWYKPLSNLYLNEKHNLAAFVKVFKVSSDYDQKEMVFRNFANILGPLSEPVLLYQLSAMSDKKVENLTVVWLDPTGHVADVNEIHIEENNLTNFIKPNIKLPLLPGVWKVALAEGSNKIAETKFLLTPLEYFSGKEVTQKEINIIHSGSQSSYKAYPNLKVLQFVPSQEEVLLLNKISQSNTMRLQEDLLEWIDSLTYEFYNILSSCIYLVSKNVDNISSCGKYEFKDCTLTRWSSLAPDPKGRIGKLNTHTGSLERI